MKHFKNSILFQTHIKGYFTLIVLLLFTISSSLTAQITTTSTPDIFRCVAGSNQLTTTPSGGTSYSYSWSPATGLSNASISNPVASPTLTTTYIVTITDIPTSSSVTDTVVITIQNIPPPLAITPQAITICQGDTTQLDVSNAPYCQPINGTCLSTPSFQTIGSGNLFAFNATDNPFFKTNNFFQQVRSVKHQYIYKASELNAAGITGPTTISSLSLDMTVSFGSHTYTNLSIKIGCTSDSVMTSAFKSGLSTVYGPISRTFNSTQFEQFAFSQAYVWDGTSNLIVEFCYTNASASNNFPFVRVNAYSSNISLTSSANSGVCGNTTGSLSNRKPNARFFYCDLAHNSTLSYAWSPSAGLSSATVKNPKANPNSTTSYILTATDNNGCLVRDTVSVVVAPSFNITVNSDTTLCEEDTLNISASNAAGAGAKYKWSSSTWIENDSLQSTRAFINGNDKILLEVTSLAGCSKKDSFNVNLVTPVEATILTDDTIICSGDSLRIEVSTNSLSCATYSNIACQSPSLQNFAGTSAFPSGGVTVSPFDGLFSSSMPGQKKQFLFTATEFANLVNANTISKIGFNVISITSTSTQRQGFTIKMGCTSTSAFPFGASNFITGLQTVFTPKTINVGTGWNDFSLDNAFVWDGVSNVVVEICWQNSSSLGTNFTTLNWTNNSFSCVLVQWNTTNFCSAAAGAFATTIRPEMRFTHCSSPPNPGYDFKWTPNTNIFTDTIPQPLVFPTATTQYVLNVVDPLSGCTDSDSIIINTAPDFNTVVSNDTTLCSADSVALNVAHNATTAVTYNWMPSADVTDSSISNPWTYVNGFKTIVSEVRSSLGCIKWDTINMGLYDQIDLELISPTGMNCEGDSVQFDSKVSLACGQSNSALCSPTSTLVMGNSTSTTSLFNVTPFIGSNLSSKKQYLMRKAELNAAGMTGSSQLAEISFNISALGKSDYQNFSIKMGCTSSNTMGNSFKGGMSTVFEPKDVTLTAGKNWFVFDNRFNWDGSSNIVVEICYLNASTGTNSEIYYTIPNPLYNCTAYNRGNSVCNSGSATAYNRRPNIEFKYCTVSSNSYLYNWSPQPWFNDPGLSNPKAQINAPGWYKLSVTDQSSNCISEDSVQLNFMSFELEALEDTSLCTSKDYQLSALTTAVFPKYKWSPANQLNFDTIKNPKITVENGIQYILEVTDSAGCSKTDTVDINLLPKPTADATPNKVDACRFTNIQLFGTGGGTYEWSPSGGLNDPLLQNPVANVGDSTIIYLTVTNAQGCTDLDSVRINIYPSPPLDLGPDTSYCIGGSFVLDAGSGFVNYLWQDNSKQQSFLVEGDGKYWVRTEDAFACIFSDTVDIGLKPKPVTDFKYFTDLCDGDSVILDALNPGASYKWSTGETTQQIIVKEGGFYLVEIDDGTCIGKDSTNVNVFEYPITYLLEKDFYCEKEFPFGKNITAGPDDYKYKWSNGQVTPSIVVTSEGIYTVQITNGGKCMVEVETDIKQVCTESIFVPNSFTPNSDLKNDVFRISAINLDEMEFRIFNRWGEVIFYSTSPDLEWDGTFKGKPLGEGVYVWRMDYKMKMADGTYEDRNASGSISLIR